MLSEDEEVEVGDCTCDWLEDADVDAEEPGLACCEADAKAPPGVALWLGDGDCVTDVAYINEGTSEIPR